MMSEKGGDKIAHLTALWKLKIIQSQISMKCRGGEQSRCCIVRVKFLLDCVQIRDCYFTIFRSLIFFWTHCIATKHQSCQ